MEEFIYPGGTKVLVWRLEEEAPQLLSLCREAGGNVEDLLELPAKRQREKAAERLLLCQAFGRPVTLCHDAQGAPFIEGLDVNISITHTPRLVALALDERRVIGLDAEQTDRQQVLRVRDKFLNASERQLIAPDDLNAHVVAWTAKEAIIKAERNSAIDWTDGITLSPFVIADAESQAFSFTAQCGNAGYCMVTRLVRDHYMTIATLREQ